MAQTAQSTADLQAQLREAQNRRLQAAQAEEARLAAEARHRKTIEAEEAQIAALAAQVAQSALNDAVQRDREFITANQAAVARLTEALNKPLSADYLTEAYKLADELESGIAAQAENVGRSLGAYQAYAIAESQKIEHPNAQYNRQTQMIRTAESRFAVPMPLHGVVMLWIKAASTPDEKRLRQGLGYIVQKRDPHISDPAPHATADVLKAEFSQFYWAKIRR